VRVSIQYDNKRQVSGRRRRRCNEGTPRRRRKARVGLNGVCSVCFCELGRRRREMCECSENDSLGPERGMARGKKQGLITSPPVRFPFRPARPRPDSRLRRSLPLDRLRRSCWHALSNTCRSTCTAHRGPLATHVPLLTSRSRVVASLRRS
jgi:hypothetical protein